KKLHNLIRCMNELKRSGVDQCAQKARHVCLTKRIVSCRGKSSSRSLSRFARLEFRLSFGCEWELFLRPFTDWVAVGAAATLQPNSAQIVGIMRRSWRRRITSSHTASLSGRGLRENCHCQCQSREGNDDRISHSNCSPVR